MLLLAFPFNTRIATPLLSLIILPYFLAQASDLKLSGYKRLDVLRIYGFNLILLPVNLAGVGSSLLQGMTRDKSVFGRTPKVRDRTVPSLSYVLAPYLIVALAMHTLVLHNGHQRLLTVVYAVLNALLTVYAIVAFIGLRRSVADVGLWLKAWLYVPVSPAVPRQVGATVPDGPVVHWAEVLHFGGDAGHDHHRPTSLGVLDTGDLRISTPTEEPLPVAAIVDLATPGHGSTVVDPQVSVRVRPTATRRRREKVSTGTSTS